MNKIIISFVLVAISVSSVFAACGIDSVDLSSMTKSTDYTGSDKEYTYKMNVCGLSADAGCGQSICQYDSTGAKVAGLGKWDGSSQPIWAYRDATDKTKGVKATFTNGDSCWMGTPQIRNVIVDFPCGSDASTFTLVEDPKCTFTLTLPTSKSCPGGGGGGKSSGGISGGWVFIIILLVVVPIYVVGGCIYKRKKLGASGNEACPNYDFWSTLPGLVRDGFRFTVGGCKRGGSYNQL